MTKHSAHLTALGVIMIWGTTYVSTKLLLVDFTPMEILLLRFIIGYLVLLLIDPHPFHVLHRHHEWSFLAAGITGVSLYFLLESIALQYTLASNVGILISVAPMLTAILAHFILHDEPLRPRFIIGFVMAIIGIVLIGLNGQLVLKLNPLGDFLALLCALVWALYSIIMRKLTGFGYPALAVTRRIFFYGLITMLPLLLIFDFRLAVLPLFKLANLLNLLYLGLGASALCFVGWNWAVSKLGAVKTSFYIYIVPVVTLISAAVILKEKITFIALIGALLTLGGLFVSEGEKFISLFSGKAAVNRDEPAVSELPLD